MIEIIIEDDIFISKNTHLVDTKIHLRYKDSCFPSETWTDFTFPILEEWKNGLLAVRHDENISFQLYFHDGPFWLVVHKKMEQLKIECINGREEKR